MSICVIIQFWWLFLLQNVENSNNKEWVGVSGSGQKF